MAHRSWVSPNGKWVLISEMDKIGWRPCRIVPFDGSNGGETVGRRPRVYLRGLEPGWANHVLQRGCGRRIPHLAPAFSRGTPEQLTFGATQEEGIAISPDGHTLITSAGIRESTVWFHDQQGDRQISGEGFASMPGLGSGAGAPIPRFRLTGRSCTTWCGRKIRGPFPRETLDGGY